MDKMIWRQQNVIHLVYFFTLFIHYVIEIITQHITVIANKDIFYIYNSWSFSI